MNAAEQIRADLASEAQVRSRRGYALLVAWAGAAATLAFILKPRPDLGPPDAMAQAIAAAFILFGASVSFSPNLRFGRWSARAIGVVAILSPLFAARALGAPGSVLSGTFKCMGVITAIGFVTLVVGRLILGRTRRRFGGAPLLQSVAAAMVGSLAVGLHCPMSDVTHLVTHAAGVFVVVALLRRLTLTET